MLKLCQNCQDILVEEKPGYWVCPSCGSVFAETVKPFPVPDGFDENAGKDSTAMLNMAERSLAQGDYDEAFYAYQTYLENHPESAEAYWGKVLSHFGIRYETEKTAAGEIRRPTLNRMDSRSILQNADYLKAIEYADEKQKAAYEKDAKYIAEVQSRYAKMANAAALEKSYDVFISYKATDDQSGQATEDSRIASEIYERLSSLGNLNVFYARVTLNEERAGLAYEPFIYAALNTAKVMILVGTKPEYLTSTWVKNEWKRYLQRMQNDSSRHIIPVLKGMTAAELPADIPAGDARTYEGRKTLLELTDGVLNYTKKGAVADVDEKKAVQLLVENMKQALAQKDFKRVNSEAEKILMNYDAHNGEAFYYKLLAEYEVDKPVRLKDLQTDWTKSNNYRRIMAYGDNALKTRIESIRKLYDTRVAQEKQELYVKAENERLANEAEKNIAKARELIGQYHYGRALDLLIRSAAYHEDAKGLIDLCNTGIEAMKRIGRRDDYEGYYFKALEKKNNSLFRQYKTVTSANEGLEEPGIDSSQAWIGAIAAGIGLAAFMFLVPAGKGYTAVMLITIGSIIASLATGRIIPAGAALVTGVLGMLFVWAGGRSLDVSLIICFFPAAYLLILGVVNIVRNINYEKKTAEQFALNSQVADFIQEEWNDLHNTYADVLGEGFLEPLDPAKRKN